MRSFKNVRKEEKLKAVEVMYENFMDIVYFIVYKIIVVWFNRSVSHGIRWHCSFHFRCVTDKVVLTLQVYFARIDGIL